MLKGIKPPNSIFLLIIEKKKTPNSVFLLIVENTKNPWAL